MSNFDIGFLTMSAVRVLCLISLFVIVVQANPYNHVDDDHMHMHRSDPEQCRPRPENELEQSYWIKNSKDFLATHKKRVFNTNSAKNVILFIGDGMSITTLAAARAYMGQMDSKPGEESWLSFEKFPVTGLSKTYCVDQQVADSACSATAYLGGVKGNDGTIGVNAKVCYKDCQKMNDNTTHVESIAKLFLDQGRSAGLVTTTKVTHASPAGVYAHTANRDWEWDTKVMEDNEDPEECRDIAYQLVHNDPGKRLKVILGGGRKGFRNETEVDEEGQRGARSDSMNLIDDWKNMRVAEKKDHKYVWNRKDLLEVNGNTDYLLGLFEGDHCQYHLLGNPETEPTLAEMVEAAIKVISKDDNGYFLFVEGGRIDHGHHDNLARLALDETVEFSKAIAKAVEMTDRSDTLLVVTSDHSHVMSYGGYPDRGNPILGSVGYNARDDITFLTLNYANGPGHRPDVDGARVDVTKEDMDTTSFVYPAMVPLKSETHGGEDVAVFALGPYQHLFTGVYEQSSIPYMMGYASCINEDDSACSSASIYSATLSLIIMLNLIIKYIIH